LVRLDAEWIPDGDGSLYLRPFMFADDVFLGVRPAMRYIFCVIASPVGVYFKGGAKPIRLWVSENFSRAGSGGTGAAKCGGNYAASLAAQAEASEQGCDQVVFLDAAERRWVEELGGMNIFFVMADGQLITPPLGTILAGITRDSIIQLARAQGMVVHETPYSFGDWQADAATGKLREVFVCGTAATVVSVGSVRARGGAFSIGDGQSGPVSRAMHDKLVAIQRVRAADPLGWRKKVLTSVPEK
jgi:branched-chain amino acid aminotransferase